MCKSQPRVINWRNLVVFHNLKSTQGHHLKKKIGSIPKPNVIYQVSRSSANWFWRRRILNIFTIHGHATHFGHVNMTNWKSFWLFPTHVYVNSKSSGKIICIGLSEPMLFTYMLSIFFALCSSYVHIFI